SGNQTTAWKGFETARASCISCHQAEAVAHINDQPMFTDLVVPSD
ncbi:MAG: mono/diheme cytochrome c family protein, partial [Hyphomicrobiaceae bacterium]